MGERDEDQSLVEQCLRGDPEAFASLVRRHQRMIHALTFRMTGSLADAEDLAQETFIQAHRQLDSFRAEARFSSWLYRIAINRCLSWRKRAQRQEQVLAEWRQEVGPAPASTDDLAQRVQEALMQLHPKQRAAVVLTTYDGLSHAEAAHALGCSETTVSWRIFAARHKLKRLLRQNRSRHE